MPSAVFFFLSVIAIAMNSLAEAPAKPAPAHNAATYYQQALKQLPQTKADAEIFDNWGSVAMDEKTLDLLKRCQPVRDLLHRAAAAKSCDWGWDYSQGMALQVPELRQIRAASPAAALWIRADFEQNKETQAVSDAHDMLVLARRIEAEPMIVAALIGRGVEAQVRIVLAAYLPRLSAPSLKKAAELWDQIPPQPPLADAVRGDGRMAGDSLIQSVQTNPQGIDAKGQAAVAEQVRKLQDLWSEAARIAAMSPDEADRAAPEYAQKVAEAPPALQKLLINKPASLAFQEAQGREHLALFLAAISITKDGPGAVKSTKDPVGGAPFTYVAATGGFELRGKLSRHGMPVSLVVGPDALR